MINTRELEHALTVAASEYACEWNDSDFECIVKVTCENGWAKATLISQEEGGEE